MSNKKIIPYINTENEVSQNVIQLVTEYDLSGADELFLYNYSIDEISQEEFFKIAKEVKEQVDSPFYLGLFAARFETIKKAFYTGASYVVLRYSLIEDILVVKEAVKRFGKNKIIIEFDSEGDFKNYFLLEEYKTIGIYAVLLKHVKLSETLFHHIARLNLPIIIRDDLIRNDLFTLMNIEHIIGVSTNYFEHKEIRKAKLALKEEGIYINTFESAISFDEFKLNQDGLIPVVTQDYKTGEVLMLAYMNKEAFEQTIQTQKMTYWSRSRNTLWCKGETSGHFQYIKELKIDCDKDTILAKVHQIGSACHTGNPTCFFTDLVKKEYNHNNPFLVLQDVYHTIIERKEHPKEGSYTNYLLEKGIDKILKKCGEEATEIIIAAKNPDLDELKYEISDFLYHMMVLMVERGLNWKDIIKELESRK